MQISEVLHHAADVLLSEDGHEPGSSYRFSCDAIRYAIPDLYPTTAGCFRPEHRALRHRIEEGLQELGLETESLMAFNDIPQGFERQAARYNWLKFCALLAEEQGE